MLRKTIIESLQLLLRLLGLEYSNSFFQIVERAQAANFGRKDDFVGLRRRLHVLGDQFLNFHLAVTSFSDFAISFNARHVSISSSEQDTKRKLYFEGAQTVD